MENNELGERMRLYRFVRRLSQADLADAVGKSQATISNFERGHSTPSGTDLQIIAHTLSVELSALGVDD